MFAKKVKSYAKVNLSLNVTGAAGGYHLIDSVLASIDIYDTVCVIYHTVCIFSYNLYMKFSFLADKAADFF